MAATKEKLEGNRRTCGVATPPEGGWGWMIVASCFLATICIRAVTRCVSIFFVEFQLQFEKDYSTTAWIHSLVDSTTMLCAPLGGFLGNRLSCRATVMLGGLLSASGLVLSSFASSLESLYIFLGLLTGLGFALSYTPAVAMVGKYFSEKKTLAYGIAMSGSGIGTFILAPAVQLLIEHYSWRGALLILGGFVSNLCVCGALMRPLESKGDLMWKNNLPDLERDCITTVLDSKETEQVLGDCSQVEAKQLEINKLKDTPVLLIANGALKNFRLENGKLGQADIALLSSPSLSELGLKDVKIAECILFSNKLTETMLLSASDRIMSDAKLVERMNLNNKFADMDALVENSRFREAKATGAFPFDQSITATDASTNTTTLSRVHYLCLKTREDFGFLLMPDFLVLSVSFLFLAYGCGAPVVYLVPYALSVGVDHKHAAFLMSIFGVSSIVGNITFGWIMDRKCLKPYRMLSYVVAIGMEGLCCMFVPFLHSFSLLVPFSIFYGYFDGAYVALIPVVTSDIVGSTCLTSALGIVHFLHAIPYLVSPPIGGWLVDRTGNYAATFSLCGASFMCSSVLLATAAFVRYCQRSKSKSAAHSNPGHTAAASHGVI